MLCNMEDWIRGPGEEKSRSKTHMGKSFSKDLIKNGTEMNSHRGRNMVMERMRMEVKLWIK